MKARSKPAVSKSQGKIKSSKVNELRNKPKNKALHETKAFYRNALDNLLEGCQILNHDWRYLYLNDVAAVHNRRPNQELLGNLYMHMWPGIESTTVFAQIKRCMEERIPAQFENRFSYLDGDIRWLILSLQPIPEGVLILSIDIKEIARLLQNRSGE
jgi:PAS domain-containing protein